MENDEEKYLEKDKTVGDKEKRKRTNTGVMTKITETMRATHKAKLTRIKLLLSLVSLIPPQSSSPSFLLNSLKHVVSTVGFFPRFLLPSLSPRSRLLLW